MTWIAPEVSRSEAPTTSGERRALESWLDYHRATLLHKCAGLDGGQLVTRAAAPSSLSLLGLVRHMAEVERWWFRWQFAGLTGLGELYCTDEMPDGDFDRTDAKAAEADLATFLRECELARATASGRSLDETFTHTRNGRTYDLRWVYLHMIEEYARHNGHADLLRERIDGATGD